MYISLCIIDCDPSFDVGICYPTLTRRSDPTPVVLTTSTSSSASFTTTGAVLVFGILLMFLLLAAAMYGMHRKGEVKSAASGDDLSIQGRSPYTSSADLERQTTEEGVNVTARHCMYLMEQRNGEDSAETALTAHPFSSRKLCYSLLSKEIKLIEQRSLDPKGQIPSTRVHSDQIMTISS